MKLYVCWSTRQELPGFGEHPCGQAYHALVDAGHDPQVIRSYGWTKLPDALNATAGRKAAERLTGERIVPVLETDDGEAVYYSQEIVRWAQEHPAAGRGAPDQGERAADGERQDA